MRITKEESRLVDENRGLVGHIAQRYTKKYNEFDEFFQIGCIGLIKGAVTFDKCKNITFSTYAGRCINNEILMHLRAERKHKNNISIEEQPAHSTEEERRKRCIFNHRFIYSAI